MSDEIAELAPPTIDPKRDLFQATVEINQPICQEHFLLQMRINPDGPAFPATTPGQFIQLGCRQPELAEGDILGAELQWSPDAMPKLQQAELCDRLALLRRPFSLAGRGDDEQGTWLRIIHRVVGVGTQWLSELQPGDPVDLIGPLGNQFDLSVPGKSLGLLVGGGVGLPPMFYLAEAMQKANWDAVAFVGAMTRDLLAVTFDQDTAPTADGEANRCVTEFAMHDYPAVITTDDGSMGLKGRITAGLEKVLSQLSPQDKQRAVLFTCGPEPMMHAAYQLAEQHGVDCQVCLEQAMACGMATCQSCVVRIEEHQAPHGETDTGRLWRYRLACTDGPVFAAGDVIW